MKQDTLKNASTVCEQILKLKSRGMIIGDEVKARENLLDIGYYRLGFYWFPFEKTYPRKIKRNHEFKEGTYFEYAISLYYFDFDLRNLFLRYISRVEINFRTKLIYIVSNKYKEDPFWYTNCSIVNKEYLNSDVFRAALRDVGKESVIKIDLKCHKRQYAPAWKALEFMSFGVILLLYDNLLDGKLRHDIAKEYGMESSRQFSNYMNTVRRLRNYCAHGKVLFDMNLSEAISSGPLGDLGSRKTMLSGAYKVFRYMLSCVSSNRVKDLDAGLNDAWCRVEYGAVKAVIINNSGMEFMQNGK